MEQWDIYDRTFTKTGRIHIRGNEMQDGDYHLVVHIWPVNAAGEYLVQKRPKWLKWKPGMWAVTGGSVLAGEEMFPAAKRELKEELGITVKDSDWELFQLVTRRDYNNFCAIWLVWYEGAASELVLQPEEVEQAAWKTKEELLAMAEEGTFSRTDYMEELFRHTERILKAQ